ncbi:T9SS type A sorting domain-containing protein [Flavobacterium caeni]|uniref:Conserved repeat domain-containing protein/Por secretion system C-terminal sorting domain-containing protein n=1 Tax=Flavobacterium caeni TaxID=490189 RepID=A0A1G5B419_9FLAO|nr:T9SS type A sorting domain-containing protein [Flavobacterium caeni]SCX84914.1 conserved repeat domain-containing protein/Por secretion system C-terminal sorting domain-containing protein [Flavobacterium caeni]
MRIFFALGLLVAGFWGHAQGVCDKLVAQGEHISLLQLDDYLNYTVRFQNTGTYAVQTVVIQDVIATNLDVGTLQTTSASHPYRAELTDNKLEIIFENINLPPASANAELSQGFATFKVKAKTSVGIGDVLANTAEVFFDLNAPVVTNTVTTTVMATLGQQTFDRATFTVYPNPTSSLLHLKSSGDLDTVTVFNSLGQTILQTSANTIDTSGWASGFYLVRASAQGRESSQKFFKL